MKPLQITLQPDDNAPIVPKALYGQFSEHLGHCIYGGIWVGEDSKIPNVRGIRKDTVAALKELKIPVLRWPGGCFADEYHWMDGIGPRKDRPSMYNSHWGGVVENNHFGTHEFFDLAGQIGCETYVCGNLGSGTVREMSEWVEYITSAATSPMADLRRKHGQDEPWKLEFFGVGNEPWGCGGNMRPEHYADEYRRYNTFVRNYGPHHAKRVAAGPNGGDTHWTTVMMEIAGRYMDAIGLHNYTLLNQTWPPSGSATEFGEKEYRSILNAALHMEDLIKLHSDVMDKFDPEKRVSLSIDEWGTWYPVEPGTNPGFLFQQNTMRDALVASVHFDLFHRHCERVRMANIAQLINVLQTMLFTNDDGVVRTPTYWAFWLYRDHQDAKFIPVDLPADQTTGDGDALPAISATATTKDGQITISISNLDPKESQTIGVCGLPVNAKVKSAHILAAPTVQAHNTFEKPDNVKPVTLQTKNNNNGSVEVQLPPASLATLTLTT